MCTTNKNRDETKNGRLVGFVCLFGLGFFLLVMFVCFVLLCFLLFFVFVLFCLLVMFVCLFCFVCLLLCVPLKNLSIILSEGLQILTDVHLLRPPMSSKGSLSFQSVP